MPTENWRWLNANDIPAKRSNEGGNTIATLLVHGRIPDDAAFAPRGARFELRLYQCDELTLGDRKRQKGRQHFIQAYEAHVARNHHRRVRIDSGFARQVFNPFARQRTRIRLFQRDDMGIARQTRMELPLPDINGDHQRRAAREQDLREAAGRSTDVKTRPARRTDPEVLERMCQLRAAARSRGMRGARLTARTRRRGRGSLRNVTAGGFDQPRLDRGARLG